MHDHRSRGVHRARRAGWLWLVAAIVGTAACGTTVTPGDTGATGGGGFGGSGTAGSSPGCANDVACDDGNPCTHDACVDGTCASSPDDTGVPDDGESCTADTCEAGVAHHTALPAGTPCLAGSPNAPGACSGQGICLAGDCGPGLPPPIDPGPCATVTGDPTTGACVIVPLPDGIPVPGVVDMPGDCHVELCIGGQPESIVDDSDLPVDGKDCTADTCSSGVPSNPLLAAGTPCGGGFVCNASGDCGCASDADCAAPTTCGGSCAMTPLACGCCPATCAALGKTCGIANDGCFDPALVCDTGAKDGQETDVDCGGPASACATRCAQGKKCSATSDCQAGLTCADGVCCGAPCSGSCEACTAAKKGNGADGVCGPIQQGTDPDAECAAQPVSTCGTSGTCDGAGACGLWPAGTVCAAPSCANGTLTNADACNGAGVCVDGGVQSCGAYKCNAQGTACLTMCANSADCQGALTCLGGQCVILDGACSAGNQCASGFCVDGVCCNTSCAGLCTACSAAKKGQGANGTCGLVAAGTDPDNECAGALSCNGAGACN